MFINPSQFKTQLQNASEHLLFFQDLKRITSDNKIIETLIDKFYFIQLCEKQVLFNIGDKDTNLYILLKGKLEVQMDIDNIMIKVKTLKPIETFNEISVISKYSKKTQTIIATSYTILAVLDRLHYVQLFGRIKQEIIDEKISQLQLFSCFESWTYGLFRRFSFYLVPLHCEYNQVIFKEGDESEFLYIIQQGEFQMLKTIVTENANKQKTLCLLNKGQIIGEECFLNSLLDQPKIECPQIAESIKRYSTVKCKSLNGGLYRIKKSDIQECLWDELTRYNFEQLLNQLKKFRIQRFKELQDMVKQQQKIQQSICYSSEQTPKLIEIKTYRNIKFLKQEQQYCTSSPKAQKQKNKIKLDAFDLKEVKPKIQMVSSTNRTTNTNIDTSKICNHILKKLNSIREPESPLMKNKVITRKRTFHKQLSVQQSQRKKTNQSVGQFDTSEDYGEDFDIKEFIYEKRQFLANAQIRHQKNNRI